MQFYEIKYVGVQNWKATHLPTLDIRVEQIGSLVMKDNKKVKKMKKKIEEQNAKEKGCRKTYSMVANLIKTVAGQKKIKRRVLGRLIQWWQIW